MSVSQEQLEKYAKLQQYIRELESVAVAYSGGVDSTFLLQVAHDVLGDRAVAVTVSSSLIPGRELSEASEFCEGTGIRQRIHTVDVLNIDGIAGNPPNRCYLCKKSIFQGILEIAREEKLCFVAEGSNVDDDGDYRPGLAAVAELGIVSPLRQAGLTKADIRALSKMLGLATWEKPSYACLASRFVYGERITEERLRMVEQAEQFLFSLGYRQMRVRLHGTLARIEALPQEIPGLMEEPRRTQIVRRLEEIGFSYVTVDMTGYRMGSMNDTIGQDVPGMQMI